MLENKVVTFLSYLNLTKISVNVKKKAKREKMPKLPVRVGFLCPYCAILKPERHSVLMKEGVIEE